MCQLNPNAWRLIVSMQVLWREVFEGDRPLTVDEFLFCYKPSEINQSQGFYQFTAKGSDYRLINSLVSLTETERRSFSSSLVSGLGTLLRLVGIHSLLILEN